MTEVAMLKRWMPVLVVDDSLTMCAIMQEILHALDFNDVQMRRTATEAINELKRREYGFVLCDVDMPAIDGFELVDMMRHDKFLRDVPVILTSAYPDMIARKLENGRQFPASGFIRKPFTALDLRDKLSEVIESAYQRKELLPRRSVRVSGFETI
jgi:chemosensory pili system protein ChpA (sensor histidine kinase/response regulator)